MMEQDIKPVEENEIEIRFDDYRTWRTIFMITVAISALAYFSIEGKWFEKIFTIEPIALCEYSPNCSRSIYNPHDQDKYPCCSDIGLDRKCWFGCRQPEIIIHESKCCYPYNCYENISDRPTDCTCIYPVMCYSEGELNKTFLGGD